MSTLNEKLKQNPINIKDAVKYIDESKQYILLTHEQFLKLCVRVNIEKKLFVIETNLCDFIVEGEDDCTYILDGDEPGSIIVVGSNNCNAARSGIGIGDAIRVGDGGGDSFRDHNKFIKDNSNINILEETMDVSRYFIGNSIRDGSGFGHALFESHFAGNALRIGSGKGNSFSLNKGHGVNYNSTISDDNKERLCITRQSKDLLNIPKHLASPKEDLIAIVYNYEDFKDLTEYVQHEDNSDRNNKTNSYYLQDITTNIIIDLTKDVIKNNNPINLYLYASKDCSIEVRISNLPQPITVTRKDDFNGHVLVSGTGNGNVIRLGNGDGHSLLLGDINGTARRVGKGIGESYKEGNGLGGVSNIKEG